MLGQLFEGTLSGLTGLLIAGFGYGFYVFGIRLVEGGVIDSSTYRECVPRRPKWKAICWALSVAAVLGILASHDYTEYDGSGDGIYPGEVVEVHKNHAPWFSFAKVFTFVAATTCFGAYKAETRSDEEP